MSQQCINCHFLAKIDLDDGKGNQTHEELSLESRKDIEDGVSFRNVPRYLACYRNRWMNDLTFVKGKSQLIEVTYDYSSSETYSFLCEHDKEGWNCFADYQVGKPFNSVIAEIESERIKRERERELGFTREQLNIDRRLLIITVVALVITAFTSLASIIVSIIALNNPVKIEGTIPVRIENEIIITYVPAPSTLEVEIQISPTPSPTSDLSNQFSPTPNNILPTGTSGTNMP